MKSGNYAPFVMHIRYWLSDEAGNNALMCTHSFKASIEQSLLERLYSSTPKNDRAMSKDQTKSCLKSKFVA